MPPTRRRVVFFIATQASLWPVLGCFAASSQAPLDAPNVVEISPHIVTSGQPSAAALAELGKSGFTSVIYLAPPTVPDAVADEGAIVTGQGLAYLNVPIRFNSPNEQDFEAFAAGLATGRDGKTLVHCQVNMRASSMVFLYRAIVLKEDPQHAYESVAKVWSPDGNWRRFIVSMLDKNHIAFEPY